MKDGKQRQAAAGHLAGKPNIIRVAKTNYKATVMKIVDHYDDGRIKTVELIPDNVSVDLTDESNRHFLIAYVNESMLGPQGN